jgi:single-strand DNA-binding protein
MECLMLIFTRTPGKSILFNDLKVSVIGFSEEIVVFKIFDKGKDMSKGINKVILLGYLGKDPVVKHLTNGAVVANFSLATQDEWKDKNTGQKEHRTEWHTIVAFNKLAEVCEKYIKKGSKIYVEGALKTKKWQDKSGIDRYTTEIHINELQMLDTKGSNENSNLSRSEDIEIPF